jgi:hypothetical protein
MVTQSPSPNNTIWAEVVQYACPNNAPQIQEAGRGDALTTAATVADSALSWYTLFCYAYRINDAVFVRHMVVCNASFYEKW